MKKSSSALSRFRGGSVPMVRVVASLVVANMAITPINSAAQMNDPIKTNLGRYFDPVTLGELGGFVVGMGIARPLFHDEYGDSFDYTIRAVTTALMIAHVGGIVGATTVALDKKCFLLYSVAAHAAIGGGIYLSSPDLSNSMAKTAALFYLVAAPVMTMGIASLIDSSYDKNNRQISVQPNVVSFGNRWQAGLSLTWAGL